MTGSGESPNQEVRQHVALALDRAGLSALVGRCEFPDRPILDCAVSGGADSSALMILALAAGHRVHVFHIDHAIRAESDLESLHVAEMARRFGSAFTGIRCPVLDGPDLEARARRARHGALPAGVLFGHTMDDQAETVLLRMIRGTGPSGLAAMSTAQHPILALRRCQTEAVCAALGIDYITDPSNENPRFTRNRVRNELIPLLDDIAQRDTIPLIARLATKSAEMNDAIAVFVDRIDPADAKAVTAAPDAVASEAMRRWFAATTGEIYPPDASAVERMLAVARGESKACEIASGWNLRRSAQRLRLEKDVVEARNGDSARDRGAAQD